MGSGIDSKLPNMRMNDGGLPSLDDHASYTNLNNFKRLCMRKLQ